ncbi:GGDEF domain-containing protein [Escherichia albertii]|uniref:sensor domain-containing diguanylate cyclase n=2 Tax=Escherichia albertii TaxID=208962 RepID=UPI0021D44186|nr:sensor domain-containing diguanylate cyclase [Escherichia albertii]MCU7270966.1 GGDEF domain-containing protein [Escherichia albertii]
MTTRTVPVSLKIFAIIFIFVSFFLMKLHEKNWLYLTQTTQTNYIIFIVGLFFINLMICIFMFLYYTSHQKQIYLLILSIAFLNNLYYFIETIIIVQTPISSDSLIIQKANDIAIFYFFRQISFVLITCIAIFASNLKENTITKNKWNILAILFSTLILILISFIAWTLSSGDNRYSIDIVYYSVTSHQLSWNTTYIKTIIYFWLLLLVSSCFFIKNYSKVWCCISFISVALACDNLILLHFMDTSYPIWYWAKGLELISSMYIISTLMYFVFLRLKYANYMAIHDFLTDIYNRGSFLNTFKKILKNNSNNTICVLMMDIDHFKKVNDQWGHHTGDIVINTVTKIIAKTIRRRDLFGRLGGEEFAVVFNGLSLAQITSISERIRRNIEIKTQNLTVKYGVKKVTISIGGFVANSNKFTPSEMLINADKALYEAKRTGRNKVVIYTSD